MQPLAEFQTAAIKRVSGRYFRPARLAKEAIAKAAIAEGVTRIGWANSFIHLDVDLEKTQNIVWGYGNNPPTFSHLENLA